LIQPNWLAISARTTEKSTQPHLARVQQQELQAVKTTYQETRICPTHSSNAGIPFLIFNISLINHTFDSRINAQDMRHMQLLIPICIPSLRQLASGTSCLSGETRWQLMN
jgi:hypothetical protein